MATKTLHALLVAINDYPIKRHKLRGCVPDRDAFKTYLQQNFKNNKEVKLKIKTLTNDEATKDGIIAGFKHFEAAKDGDICVFYFSGHGSQVPAPKEFWHTEPDRMNESVVCYDSRLPGKRDLFDKEQSHLIYKATEGKDVHFVAIYDCCHAGSNTRGVDNLFVSRMAEPSETPTEIKDYFGYKEYMTSQDPSGITNYQPKRGTHIQFAAAKSNEAAREMKINGKFRGIFTYYLIESLEKTGSKLTYGELINAVNIRVSSKIEDQTPLMDVVATGSQDTLSQGLFLDGSIQPKAAMYTINKKRGKWIMDAGGVHGISDNGGRLQLLDDKSIVTIGKVHPNHAEVEGMGNKPDGIYRAVLLEMNFNKMKVAFGKGCHKDGRKILKNEIDLLEPIHFEVTRRKADADYIIYCRGNSYQLTRPGDDRPVFRRVKGYDENSALIFIQNMAVVAKYQNLVELDNPRTSIGARDIKLELFRVTEVGNLEDDAADELVNLNKPAVFSWQKKGRKWHCPAFRLKITNESDRTLYFSSLYMEDNFDITNKFMKKVKLEPGEFKFCEETLRSGKVYKTITLDWKEEYHKVGVIENMEFIKIIASTEATLDTDKYNQKGLELDDEKEIYVSDKAGREDSDLPKEPDWTTRTIKLKVTHPMEQAEMDSSYPAEIMGVKINAPSGVSAQVCLSNVSEAERGLDEGMVLPPPDNIWGNQELAESFEFSKGGNNTPGLSVLELREISGKDQVHSNNPMVVETGQKLKTDELIVPMGFDPDTGMYYPLGISDQKGKVTIETLPEESNDGNRSLGGSIKIFFQKVVLTKLGFEYKHPQLALPVFESNEGEEFNYETDISKIATEVKTASTIAIFMHGIIGDTVEMAKSARRIKKEDGTCLDSTYDLVLTFDYENLKTEIQQTAKDLGKRLSEVGLTANHGKTVHIIAHSMGGLVSRWFIEKEGGKDVISHLFQVGTPNEGSPWSDVYELASALLSKAVNGATFLKPYILPLSILGKYAKVLFTTLAQMDPDNSEFLKKLNDGTDPEIPYTIIAGNTKLIPVQYEAQQGILKRIIQRFKKRGHYDALDVLLFKEPNDIAVSVKSIVGIKGKENRKYPPKEIEVGADHISYFADPEGLKALSEAVFQK
jgi:hypothetical protein